jgi:hypothetical protein
MGLPLLFLLALLCSSSAKGQRNTRNISAFVVVRPLALVSGNTISVYISQIKHAAVVFCVPGKSECFLCEQHEDSSTECTSTMAEEKLMQHWCPFDFLVNKLQSYEGVVQVDVHKTLREHVSQLASELKQRYSVLDQNCFAFVELMLSTMGLTDFPAPRPRSQQAIDIDFSKDVLDKNSAILLSGEESCAFFKVFESDEDPMAAVVLWISPKVNVFSSMLRIAEKFQLNSAQLDKWLRKKYPLKVELLNRSLRDFHGNAALCAEFDRFVTSWHSSFVNSFAGDIWDMRNVFNMGTNTGPSRSDVADTALFFSIISAISVELVNEMNWMRLLLPENVLNLQDGLINVYPGQSMVVGLLPITSPSHERITELHKLASRMRTFLQKLQVPPYGLYVVFCVCVVALYYQNGPNPYPISLNIFWLFGEFLPPLFPLVGLVVFDSWYPPVTTIVYQVVGLVCFVWFGLSLKLLGDPELNQAVALLGEVGKLFPKHRAGTSLWLGMIDLQIHWENVVSGRISFNKWSKLSRFCIVLLVCMCAMFLLRKVFLGFTEWGHVLDRNEGWTGRGRTGFCESWKTIVYDFYKIVTLSIIPFVLVFQNGEFSVKTVIGFVVLYAYGSIVYGDWMSIVLVVCLYARHLSSIAIQEMRNGEEVEGDSGNRDQLEEQNPLKDKQD